MFPLSGAKPFQPLGHTLDDGFVGIPSRVEYPGRAEVGNRFASQDMLDGPVGLRVYDHRQSVVGVVLVGDVVRFNATINLL